MNEAQQEDLLIEWGLHEDLTGKVMVCEYQQLRKSQTYAESSLAFPKKNLEIEGYWRMVGLA